MKLSEIASRVINEIAAAPTTGGTFYDVSKDFQNFQNTIDKQTETAKKAFEAVLSKSLMNKQVSVRASKGAVGQLEKDYSINVSGINVSYLKNEYFVVLKDKDKKDYFVNPHFKVKVIGPAAVAASTKAPEANIVQPPENSADGQKRSFGISYPQNMGMASPHNIVSQGGSLKEAIFNRNPDYLSVIDALKKDPSTSGAWKKLLDGSYNENDIHDLVFAAYRLGTKKIF